MLDLAQSALLAEARELRSGRTVEVKSLEDVEAATETGFAYPPGVVADRRRGQGRAAAERRRHQHPGVAETRRLSAFSR